MTNDALETHMVDRVRVIAVPRPNGARVLRAGDAYYPALRMAAPTSCVSASGDCLADVVRADSREYASLAGERDLAEKETIELDLPASSGARGLLVGARNTLLNTFLFYQGLAYMGRSAGSGSPSSNNRGRAARTASARSRGSSATWRLLWRGPTASGSRRARSRRWGRSRARCSS